MRHKVSKELCQASHNKHFIKTIEILDSPEKKLLSKANVNLGEDPYIERHLGHYSSGLLLEISKQIAKATCFIHTESYTENRFVVSEISMDFKNYIILEERFAVDIACNIEVLRFRKEVPLEGIIEVQFNQGNKEAAKITFKSLLLPAKLEYKLEKGICDQLVKQI
ncbi:MAG: hypothetical protein MK066_10555 [Crocinitomicaceae bacterium]|nr:hypothetical protein [Crocinitomicaceae bacterium]